LSLAGSSSLFASYPCPSLYMMRFSVGGMAGAIVTSPFDVVKTRLQSSLFQHTTTAHVSAGGTATLAGKPPGGLLYNFVETGHILRSVLSYPPCTSTSLLTKAPHIVTSIGTSLPAPSSKV
jgi:hypothetical protein